MMENPRYFTSVHFPTLGVSKAFNLGSKLSFDLALASLGRHVLYCGGIYAWLRQHTALFLIVLLDLTKIALVSVLQAVGH